MTDTSDLASEMGVGWRDESIGVKYHVFPQL